MAKGLLDLVKTESLNNEDLLLVNQNTFDKSVSVKTVVEKVEETLDSKYVNVSGDTMTGPLTITKINPEMTGVSGNVSNVTIGNPESMINIVYSDLFLGRGTQINLGIITEVQSTIISTESININSDLSFSSNKVSINYNPSDSSIDFIIN